MTEVERLAAWVCSTRFEDISLGARDLLAQRLLDSLGCALGALEAAPVRALREHVADFGGRPLSTLIGGGRTAPDRAALHNAAAVRYLDFNDCYLAPREAGHPSDNLAPVLAACEYAGGTARQLLTALAVSYQVQCTLFDVAPVRPRGFDHTTLGAFAAAAGCARALSLDPVRTANAIAIAGSSLLALRSTRTGALSNWKGLAFAHAAAGALQAAFLARRGVTGPHEVFEGQKGFMEVVSGPFRVDWEALDLEAVRRTVVKRFDAEGHAQSAVEAVLEARADLGAPPAAAVESVEADIFAAAYEIIGPGAGDKTQVATKEEADHSLPYMLAVALLDGELTPRQYELDRLSAPDVRSLLPRVVLREDPELTARFPREHAVRVRVHLRDGRSVAVARSDFEGSVTRPASWPLLLSKYEALSAGRSPALPEHVRHMHEEDSPVSELTGLLTEGSAGPGG